jgi:hypothetical protein
VAQPLFLNKKNVFSVGVAKPIKKILEFKWVFIFFSIFLVFQAYQATLSEWDSITYVFQGKWFCGQHLYLEYLRPPVPGFFNCLFGAEMNSAFFSTVFASFIYLAAIFLIYKKENGKIDQFVFALFAFVFPTILIGANYGSDLFALSFLLLALFFSNPLKKGFFFGLATLSRYNFLFYFPVFLWQFRRNPKKILLFLGIFSLVWLPWLAFNFVHTGNPFFSLNQTLYINVFTRGVASEIGVGFVLLIVFFIATVFLNVKKNFLDEKNQVSFISVVQFVFSGIKESRFLNVLVPSQAVNAARASFGNKKIKVFFVALLFLSIFLVAFFQTGIRINNYSPRIPENDFIRNCRVGSDNWVYFYPKGIVAEQVGWEGDFNRLVESETNIVLYREYSYDLNIPNAQIITTQDCIIIKFEKCLPPMKQYVSGPWID